MQTWKRNLCICWFGSFTAAVGMSMIIPFLPFYIEVLGVDSMEKIVQWSGVAYGVTFLLAAVLAPVWGRMGDIYGHKWMLIRASLGMAIVMTLMGIVDNVYQLVGLRLIMGAVSGYISSSIPLVASQSPKEQSGWALGTLSTGQVGGTLLGPLLGGCLMEEIGVRNVFFVTGIFLFIAFLGTVLFIKENATTCNKSGITEQAQTWSIPNQQVVGVLFLTTFMLQLANMSIEPIVTVYVKQLQQQETTHIALMAGAVFAAAGLSNILAAPHLGKLSDQLGPQTVLLSMMTFAAIINIFQAYAQTPWQLLVLRFLLGIAMAGMLPSIYNLIKRSVSDTNMGRIFGYNQSFQYMGSVTGPILGGQIAAHFGIPYVFFSTSTLLLLSATWIYYNVRLTGSLFLSKS